MFINPRGEILQCATTYPYFFRPLVCDSHGWGNDFKSLTRFYLMYRHHTHSCIPHGHISTRTIIFNLHETKRIVEVRQPVPLAHVHFVHKQTNVWEEILLEVFIFRVSQRLGTRLTMLDKMWHDETNKHQFQHSRNSKNRNVCCKTLREKRR